MKRCLLLDLETFSEIDIEKAGYDRYAEHPSTEILILAWAVDDGPVHVVDLTAEPMPAEFVTLFKDPDTLLVAHNAGFDRRVLEHRARLVAPLSRWYCTAARARAHALPGSLEALSAALLGEPERKDPRGKALIRLFCSPGRKGARATRETHPQQWAEFLGYAGQDIVAMRAALRAVPDFNFTGVELNLWRIDQAVNDRGFAVDLDLAKAAVRVADEAVADIDRQIATITGGAVAGASQRAALLDYLRSVAGEELDNLRAGTVRDALTGREDDTGIAAELLRLRQAAAKTSTAKYKALLTAACSDGRLRGSMVFCGAATGRWSARLFQPHNLPRQDMPQAEIDVATQAVKEGTLGLIFDKPLHVLSNLLRGCVVAAPGHKLVVADLSNIEGRVLAYIAGEEWKVEAFRAFDEGRGPDIYKKTYAESMGVPVGEVNGDQRQVGKVMELGLGYQGWVGAFLTFAAVYNLDLNALAGAVMASTELGVWADGMRAATRAGSKGLLLGLEPHVYAACAVLANKWRLAHPRTKELWAELELAFRRAIARPDVEFDAAGLPVQRSGRFLTIKLPSGRRLCYVDAEFRGDKLTYMSVDQGKWRRVATYGGSLTENVVQAAARDVLAGGIMRAEKAGYRVVLSVHDELVTEVPDSPEFTAEGLAGIMAAGEPWAPGLPLAAKGFETKRYHK
jgi:DNA polymerase